MKVFANLARTPDLFMFFSLTHKKIGEGLVNFLLRTSLVL